MRIHVGNHNDSAKPLYSERAAGGNRDAPAKHRRRISEGGDLYARMEELQTRMRNLNGRIEELEHKLDLLQRSQASAAQAPATFDASFRAPL